MKQATRDNLVMLAIMAVLVATAVLVVYRPQQQRITALREEVAQRRTSLASDAQRAAVIPQMIDQVQHMKSQYRNFDRRLPKRKELGGFLKEISNNLAQRQVSNQAIEPGNPQRQELFHTLPIKMRFDSSYLSMATLLKQIDEMERLTRVQKLSISADTQKDAELKIEVLLNIYFTET
jgi:Tfp pilus assembly protein PilO